MVPAASSFLCLCSLGVSFYCNAVTVCLPHASVFWDYLHGCSHVRGYVNCRFLPQVETHRPEAPPPHCCCCPGKKVNPVVLNTLLQLLYVYAFADVPTQRFLLSHGEAYLRQTERAVFPVHNSGYLRS